MTKRKDGRYQENVFIGTIDGVPKYKTVSGRTKKEVNQKALDVKLKYNQGFDILTGDRTKFDFWANAWLQSIKESQTDDNFKLLSSRAKVFCDMLGSMDLEKIKVVDCQLALNQIANSNPRHPHRKSSDKTIKEYHNILNRIFNFCLENRVLNFNPSNYIQKPKGTKKAEREALTNEEIKYFEDTPHPLQLCAMLMIFAGLRRGEALALTWNDIDFINRKIIVNKSVDLKQGGIIKEPKTSAGYRAIPMSEKLCNYLKQNKSNSLLVVTDNGNAIINSSWERLWRDYIRTICTKYDIDFHTSAHCLRHTFCTLLFEADVDVLTAKKYMGHSDITITMKIYTHLREQKEQLSADKLNRFIDNL